MTTKEREAAEELYTGLSKRNCTCKYEHPYDPRGKLLEQCFRCLALARWDALQPHKAG